MCITNTLDKHTHKGDNESNMSIDTLHNQISYDARSFEFDPAHDRIDSRPAIPGSRELFEATNRDMLRSVINAPAEISQNTIVVPIGQIALGSFESAVAGLADETQDIVQEIFGAKPASRILRMPAQSEMYLLAA